VDQTAVAEWGTYDGRSGRRTVSGPVEAERLCREVEGLPGTMRIPRSDAFAAVREFLRTGERPTCLAWEES
jgi:hypothetical protein